ncbi:MAG: hypothetical protein HS128_01075 [Ideonella sp.]|nr:hypothetical protein [Ideonella sp.]MCC7459436.1 hypothetical protein [Nitrospira sp.]
MNARHLLPQPHRTGFSIWTQVGMPQDRLARMATRRAFVALKQAFMQAVDCSERSHGDWLRVQVRQAHEPIDLWLLRGAVLRALPTGQAATRALRTRLQQMLDSMFPDNADSTGSLPL